MKGIVVRKALIIASFLAGAPVLAQVPAQKLSKPEREAMALTAEQASFRTSVSGADALGPGVWVSTEPFLSGRADDKFLRALIDKETGDTTYQLYLRSSSGRGAFRPSKLTYLINGAPRSAPVERIDVDVSCRHRNCTYFEDAIADLPRADLEALANNGANDFWQMRLFGETVTGVDTAMLRNETAGLLIAVDRERKRLGF